MSTDRQKENHRLYYLKHKKRLAALNKEWSKNNAEKTKKIKRNWYLRNKEKTIASSKKYRLENPEKIKEIQKKYNDANKEKRHKYYLDNKEKKNKNYINNYHSKLKYNVSFKIRRNLSNRLWYAIKNGRKCKGTMELLGCNIEFLRKHLELQFTKGMNWNNYGKDKNGWEIDHILPCASFDLTDIEQQKICFHYTNLQPLWAKDNMEKSSKIVKPQIKIIF